MKKTTLWFLTAFVFILTLLLLGFEKFQHQDKVVSSAETLKVLTYSNFLKTWGPGPDIAASFEQETGVKIQWVEVANAGMILENLRQEKPETQPDVVLGIDLLSLSEAREDLAWQKLPKPQVRWTKELPASVLKEDFVPVDWSPLTFIFRRSELPTPQTLDDLLKNNYANSLALQDPRTSSTGLYFLLWVLAVKGEDGAYDFLKKLKPSIRLISPNWSTSYSLFQNNQVPMVFSFFTSTIYHYLKEDDSRYQPVYFDDPHVYNVEYVGIPASSAKTENAQKFVNFLLTPESQKKIMEKNYMLPVVHDVKKNTPFDFPKTIQLIEEKKYEEILKNRDSHLERWKKLNL